MGFFSGISPIASLAVCVYTGVSATNANLPPYMVAYVWKRTA